jgi:transcriptional regulator with XRE-family HTH domain
MPDTFWSPELQNRLKQTRLNAGIPAEDLARHCALSMAQLRQLEEGGDSQFYNAGIKLRSGNKALNAIESISNKVRAPLSGFPPPSTLHNTPPESFNDSAHERLERVAHIQPAQHKQMAQKNPSTNSLGSRLYLFGAILVSCLSLFLILDYDFHGAPLHQQAQDVPSVSQPSSIHENHSLTIHKP